MPIAGAAVLAGFAVLYLGYHLPEASGGPILGYGTKLGGPA
jgi:hypothetical protein